MSNEIKVGDKVRVSITAPEHEIDFYDRLFTLVECRVVAIRGGKAQIEYRGKTLSLSCISPTKYLVKVDAEAKEAKFKVGDRIKFKSLEELKKIKHKSFHWALPVCAGKFATIIGIDDVGGYIVDIDKNGRGYIDDMIEFKVGPIATKFKVGDIIDTPKGNGTVHIAFDDYCAVKLDNGEWYVYMKTNIPYAPLHRANGADGGGEEALRWHIRRIRKGNIRYVRGLHQSIIGHCRLFRLAEI